MRGLSRLSFELLGKKASASRFALLIATLAAACALALACSSGGPADSTPNTDENTELTPASDTIASAGDTTTGGTLDAAASPLATSTRTPGIAYPDSALTPGDELPVTSSQVCQSGYSSSVRSVSTATKNKVYAEYHITSHPTGAFEVDHLISLELGGSNDIKNLWPEPAEPRPGFHEKDTLENKLHSLVCAGRMELSEAQREIASDWHAAYLVQVLGQAPAATPTSTGNSTPTPVPPLLATAVPTASLTGTDGHTWYTSAASNATRYYCDLDSEWKTLSPANLRSYPSEAALKAVWGASRTKSPSSHC